MAAVEVARGVEAVKRVAEVFPRALPVVTRDQWGTAIRIEPGTIWGGDRMFVSEIGGQVAFTVRDRLYTQGTADFVRDYYLIALGQGAQKAAWLIPIAQAEMAFCMGFVGTLAGIVGAIAGVTVFMAKVLVFYNTHKQQVTLAKQHLQPILINLSFFATRCPKLFWLLTKGLGGQAIQSAGKGISAADIAYFLGKLLGGAARLPELTLKGLLKAAAAALAIAVALRGPGAIAHGVPQQSQQLVRQLARDGIRITDAEAQLVLAETCLRNPQIQQKLRDLVTSAEITAPVVEALSRSLSVEEAP